MTRIHPHILGVAGSSHFVPNSVASRAGTFSGIGAGQKTSTCAKQLGFGGDLGGRMCRLYLVDIEYLTSSDRSIQLAEQQRDYPVFAPLTRNPSTHCNGCKHGFSPTSYATPLVFPEGNSFSRRPGRPANLPFASLFILDGKLACWSTSDASFLVSSSAFSFSNIHQPDSG